MNTMKEIYGDRDIELSISDKLVRSKENTSIAKGFRAFQTSLTEEELLYLADTIVDGRKFARKMFWQMLKEDEQLAYVSLVDLRVLCFDVSYKEDVNNVKEVLGFMKEVLKEWTEDKKNWSKFANGSKDVSMQKVNRR